MGKGIEIGIASETKAFKLGVESGMIAPVEGAVEALDKLGDAEGLDQLEESLEDAQDASKKLERETRDTAEAIERDFRRAYREMKESSEDGTDEASEGFETMQEKGIRGAQRIGGSFNDVGDILSGIQRTASSALSGFGPAGAVAGAVAGIGIGLVTDALKTAQEEADKMRERISSAYQSAAEDGRTFLDEAQIQAAALEIIFGQNGEREKAAKEAARIGIDTSTYIRALAGDQDALTVALEASATAAQKVHDSLAQQANRDGDPFQFEDSVNIAGQINSKLEAQQKIMADNVLAANLALQVRGQDHEQIQKNNKALADAPKTLTAKLVVDESAVDAALRKPRTIVLRPEFRDMLGVKLI